MPHSNEPDCRPTGGIQRLSDWLESRTTGQWLALITAPVVLVLGLALVAVGLTPFGGTARPAASASAVPSSSAPTGTASAEPTSSAEPTAVAERACPTRSAPISATALLGFAPGGDLAQASDSEIMDWLGRYANQLCPTIRVDASWRTMQADGPDSINFAGVDKLGRVLSAFNTGKPVDRQVSVIYVAAYAPTWAAAPGLDCNNLLCAPTMEHVPDYGNFIGGLHGHLAKTDQVYLIEIWNEENLKERFQPAVNPKIYADLLVAAAEATKGKINIFGGTSPADDVDGNQRPIHFLEKVIAALRAQQIAGLQDVVSAMVTHPYDGWAPTVEMHDYLVSIGTNLPFLASELGTKPDPQKPKQATRLADLIKEGASYQWVRLMLVYSPPSDDQGYSLWNQDGTNKPLQPGDDITMLDGYRRGLELTGQLAA